jgi:hypothetical protein
MKSRVDLFASLWGGTTHRLKSIRRQMCSQASSDKSGSGTHASGVQVDIDRFLNSTPEACVPIRFEPPEPDRFVAAKG